MGYSSAADLSLSQGLSLSCADYCKDLVLQGMLDTRRRRLTSAGKGGLRVQLQSFGKENNANVIMNETPQVSPTKSSASADTPTSQSTYDRKALSELLRVSATTLKTTHEQLQRANEQIASLQAELQQQRLSAAPVLETVDASLQTELQHVSSVETIGASCQTEPAATLLSTPSKPKPKPKPPSRRERESGNSFSSSAEFESVVEELVALRLRVFELENRQHQHQQHGARPRR